MDEKKLDYETAYRAVHGDHDAQMKVLAYYDSYINALSTVEEVKAAIQAGYLEALPKCRVMQ